MDVKGARVLAERLEETRRLRESQAATAEELDAQEDPAATQERTVREERAA